MTDGLVVVARGVGPCGHRTSLLLDFNLWVYMKIVVNEYIVHRRLELYRRIFYAIGCINDPDNLPKVQMVLNFKHPWFRNR